MEPAYSTHHPTPVTHSRISIDYFTGKKHTNDWFRQRSDKPVMINEFGPSSSFLWLPQTSALIFNCEIEMHVHIKISSSL
jgi:hypothetical protein